MVDEDTAVTAHVLLNALALAAGRAATLRRHWERVPPELRDEWLAQAQDAAVQASALVSQLARGHPLDAAMEALDRSSG